MASDPSRADYVAAKKELLPLLQTDMTPLVYDRFAKMYRDTEKFAARQFEEKKRKVDVGDAFALVAKNVPHGNAQILQKEVDYSGGHVPKIEATYKALWISSVYVLTSARLGAAPKVRASVPPFREFVHNVYSKAAGDFMNDPDIFEPDHSASTLRQNKLDAYRIISAAIPDALRALLPVQQLYQEIGRDVETHRYWGAAGPMDEESPAPAEQAEPVSEPPDVVARRAAAKLLNAEIEDESDDDEKAAGKEEEPIPPPPEGDVELHSDESDDDEEKPAPPGDDEKTDEQEREEEEAISITEDKTEKPKSKAGSKKRPMPDPDLLPFETERGALDLERASKK